MSTLTLADVHRRAFDRADPNHVRGHAAALGGPRGQGRHRGGGGPGRRGGARVRLVLPDPGHPVGSSPRAVPDPPFLPLTAAQQLVSLHPKTDMFAPALSLLVVIAWAVAALAAACVITRQDA